MSEALKTTPSNAKQLFRIVISPFEPGCLTQGWFSAPGEFSVRRIFALAWIEPRLPRAHYTFFSWKIKAKKGSPRFL
jgi:hypothetical protein